VTNGLVEVVLLLAERKKKKKRRDGGWFLSDWSGTRSAEPSRQLFSFFPLTE
jgi:hypothetical protein